MTDFSKLESKFDELKSLVLSKYDQTSEIKRLNDELNRVNEENKHEMKRLNCENMRLAEQNQQLFVQNQSLSEELRQMRCEKDEVIFITCKKSLKIHR